MAQPGGCGFEPHWGHDRNFSKDTSTGFSRKRTRESLPIILVRGVRQYYKIDRYLINFNLPVTKPPITEIYISRKAVARVTIP